MESNFWSPSSDSVLSNEDSTTRTLHRTTSAQVRGEIRGDAGGQEVAENTLIDKYVPLDITSIFSLLKFWARVGIKKKNIFPGSVLNVAGSESLVE